MCGALGEAGHRVVIVHGGGPQTTELSTRLGLAPRIVAGRRVTDAATLDVVKMVVAGRLNVDLCAALRAQGVNPLGLHGAVQAVKRSPRVISGAGTEPVDLGLVGDVVGLDREMLEWAAGSGRVPVLACLGVADGAVYNINADVVANRVAIELGADMVILVTGTDGVRRDAAEPSSRIPSLTMAEGRRAIAEGVVWGGMNPQAGGVIRGARERGCARCSSPESGTAWPAPWRNRARWGRCSYRRGRRRFSCGGPGGAARRPRRLRAPGDGARCYGRPFAPRRRRRTGRGAAVRRFCRRGWR